MHGGPTQDEILAISLFKLRIRDGDTMVDVGCGTGKVSFEAARTAGRVIAIDRRDEAVEIVRTVIENEGIANVQVHHGEATGVLPEIEEIDCAFVGGSQQLEEVLGMLAEKVSGYIVVNAVLIETVWKAYSSMQSLGIFEEMISASISRSHRLGSGTMFRPINPVYIIVGRGRRC